VWPVSGTFTSFEGDVFDRISFEQPGPLLCVVDAQGDVIDCEA